MSMQEEAEQSSLASPEPSQTAHHESEDLELDSLTNTGAEERVGLTSLGGTIDQLLEAGGGCGSYQYRLFSLLVLVYSSPAVVMMEPVFLNKLAEEVLGISSIESQSVTSFFFAAFFLGLYFWGHLGDSYGRAPVLKASLLLLTVAASLTPISTSYSCFLFGRCVSGVACAGVLNTTFVLAVEIVPSDWRAIAKGALAIGWVLGTVFLVWVAWLLESAQGMSAFSACAAPAAVSVVACVFFLPESPRFLLLQGQHALASRQLLEIAAVNLGQPDPDLPVLAAVEKSVGGSFGQLWSAELWLPSTVIGLTQGIACLTLYGVAFSSESSKAVNDPYLSALLGALVELPAYLVMCPAADRLGRRATYGGFLLLGALSMLLYVPSYNWPSLRSSSVLVSRFAAAGASTVVYIVSAEQFPTSCRNIGVGWGSSCGRVGAVLAPLVLEASSSPFLVFAALSFIAAACVYLLKETMHSQLR